MFFRKNELVPYISYNIYKYLSNNSKNTTFISKYYKIY